MSDNNSATTFLSKTVFAEFCRNYGITILGYLVWANWLCLFLKNKTGIVNATAMILWITAACAFIGITSAVTLVTLKSAGNSTKLVSLLLVCTSLCVLHGSTPQDFLSNFSLYCRFIFDITASVVAAALFYIGSSFFLRFSVKKRPWYMMPLVYGVLTVLLGCKYIILLLAPNLFFTLPTYQPALFILGSETLFFVIMFIIQFVAYSQNSEAINPTTATTAEEYNQLKNMLAGLPNATAILETAGGWLSSRITAGCLCFMISEPEYEQLILYYEEKMDLRSSIAPMYEERKTMDPDSLNEVFHANGGYSLPFTYTPGVIGFLFLGQKSVGRYDGSDCKLLKSFVRIVAEALLISQFSHMEEEKDKLQSAFSRYISPDIVKNIAHGTDLVRVGGTKKDLSVMFSDLCGFTEMSDQLDPVILVRVLNMYLNEMSQVILALGGTIDKFEGDAIMAFFGAPKPMDDHAVRCCIAAIRMKKMEDILNEQLLRENLINKPLFTRIGINSGDMIVGNIGSMQRLDYTIIGANVNIASRIEEINKVYKTAVLISENTYQQISNFCECRFVDEAELRGVRESVKIYELLEEKHGTNIAADATNFSAFVEPEDSGEHDRDEIGVMEELEEI